MTLNRPLPEILESIIARRSAAMIGSDRRQRALDSLSGNTVRGTTLYSGVVAATTRLGARNARTGQYSITTADGGQRTARAIGAGAREPQSIIPGTVFDGTGGWIDW